MSEMIFDLPVDEVLSRSLTRRRLDGMPLLVVEHPEARAAVCVQGAQVVAWQPRGQEPVVWLSERAVWAEGAPVRGGIPLCWPWFDDAGEPQHGFARTSLWELAGCDETDDAVRLTLRLGSTPATRALWPYDFELTVRIMVGRECVVELEVRADAPSVAALHTYLHVGDTGQVEIAGLGEAYTDGLREGAPGRQDGPLRLTGGEEIERYYTRAATVSEVRDGKLGRVVELRHDRHGEVVVWNPGAEQIRGIADLADDAHRAFVCVETARIARPLETNSERLSVTLTVPS